MPPSPRFEKLANDCKQRIQQISAAEACGRQAAGALLIDVREAEEFAKGHAANAIGLTKGMIEVKIEQRVPDVATPIICYCGGGNRSAIVVDNLQKMGYENVFSMTGGFRAWQEQGLPVK